MTRRLDDLLAAEGARLDATYHCPHLPEITGPCDCRKPGAAMLRKALEEFGVPAERAVMVGDTEADMQAGREAGCRTILVGEHGASFVQAVRRLLGAAE